MNTEQMNKREKVIKGLEWCAGGHTCCGCPYYNPDDTRCRQKMEADALELLKEQDMYIKILEEKLRLLEFGDNDVISSILMPAT